MHKYILYVSAAIFVSFRLISLYLSYCCYTHTHTYLNLVFGILSFESPAMKFKSHDAKKPTNKQIKANKYSSLPWSMLCPSVCCSIACTWATLALFSNCLFRIFSLSLSLFWYCQLCCCGYMALKRWPKIATEKLSVGASYHTKSYAGFCRRFLLLLLSMTFLSFSLPRSHFVRIFTPEPWVIRKYSSTLSASFSLFLTLSCLEKLVKEFF